MLKKSLFLSNFERHSKVENLNYNTRCVPTPRHLRLALPPPFHTIASLPRLGLLPHTPSLASACSLTFPPFFETITYSHKNKKVRSQRMPQIAPRNPYSVLSLEVQSVQLFINANCILCFRVKVDNLMHNEVTKPPFPSEVPLGYTFYSLIAAVKNPLLC